MERGQKLNWIPAGQQVPSTYTLIKEYKFNAVTGSWVPEDQVKIMDEMPWFPIREFIDLLKSAGSAILE